LEVPSNADSPDHNQDAHGSIAHETQTGDLLLSLASRISKLEHNKGIENHYIPEVVRKAGKYLCPNKRCDKKYVESSDLGKHCQQKHGSIGSIISQRVCYRCSESFLTTRELILHEKCEYGEDYVLRIDPFLSFFHPSSRKLTWYHFARDLTITSLAANTLPLLPLPVPDSQSPPNDQPDHTSILAQGNHLAGQSQCNEVTPCCHHCQVDNLKGPPADAPLPEISRQSGDGVHGPMEAIFPVIGQVKVQLSMSQIAEPYKEVEQANDVDLYNANGELDVNEFLVTFESENHQTYSNHSEISQGYATGLYEADNHQEIDSYLSGCASNSEGSNTKFAGYQIDDTALYNANNELDSEEFLLGLSDTWGSNTSLPQFNALQSQGSTALSTRDANCADNTAARAMF
jgi:hypothetical protein